MFKVVNTKSLLIMLLLPVLMHITAIAQDAKLDLNRISKLSDRAKEVVEVTLDQKLLQLAANFLDSKDPEEASVKELLSGIKEVYVRVFEFDKPGQYSKEDIEPIRKQLSSGWTKIVGVRSTKSSENADIYLKSLGNKIQGLVIIATEPNELTVINIIGNIDLDKLSKLEGKFGIPVLGIKKKPRE